MNNNINLKHCLNSTESGTSLSNCSRSITFLNFRKSSDELILKTYQDPNKLGLLFFLSDCAHLNVTKTAMVTYEAYNLKYMEYFTQATTATKYCYEGLFT